MSDNPEQPGVYAANAAPEPSARPPHTPGPWGYRVSRSGAVAYIQSGRAARIADVHSFSPGFGPGRAERDANARLIAVAPELLESLIDLEALLRQVAPEYADSTMAANARSVIARALDGAK